MTRPRLRSRACRTAATVSCLVGLAWLGSSCAAAPEPLSPLPAASSTSDVGGGWQAVEREIGDARCDADAQCRTMPVGHKACGGPERWLAWSTVSTDEAALRRRIDEYSLGQAQLQRDRGLMSNCAVVPDPGATCVARRCVLQGRP